jgi:hypothetical protein
MYRTLIHRGRPINNREGQVKSSQVKSSHRLLQLSPTSCFTKPPHPFLPCPPNLID